MALPRSPVLIVPGRLDTLTGGSIYDRRIVEELRRLGWSVAVKELDPSFPRPTSTARTDAAHALADIANDLTVVVDGLALGALPREAERESARLRLVALVHHPLASETGLDPIAVSELRASETRALAAVRLVVVTSQATAAALQGFGVDQRRIVVVEPGTDPAPIARGSGGPGLHLLCVAALVPRKGHETLFEALARIADRDWRLTCVGSPIRSPDTTRRLRAQLAAAGLAGRVQLVGEVDGIGLAGYYDEADVFVLPTLYEGYGMAVAEALARGLPVVSTPTGAIDELVDGAGLLVPPGNVSALRDALARIAEDGDLRERLRRGALRVRGDLPTWEQSARKMADVLVRV